MPQSGIPDVGRVREVFHEVLSQPEFRRATTESPLSALLRRVVEGLDRFFARWLPGLDPGQARVIEWAALLAVLGVTAYMLVRRFGRRELRSPPSAQVDPSLPSVRTPAAWASWARERAMEGKLREAASGIYQAVILHLENRGALRYGEWKTPGDYAVELSGDAVLRVPFRGFLALFVGITFGPADPTPEALATLFERAEQLGCPT